ncbi:DUF2380 domain-containing protein [Ancylobacter pratisalsi]|uniref:DUF2380 domain-containing protein n=1 Tax=Ancylobacter pratisalsi TaxID=1745854 RepID=A0A6P1YHP5_9HYPH|nr:DUF2380 domain-containing protein [Ancylobacter pratisalsi]QIB32605.1 DUF2380 domain-containing protein [Ancylobacter pratisalsi]
MRLSFPARLRISARSGLSVPLAGLALASGLSLACATTEPSRIAVPEIGFSDSSGEARNQQSEHEARRLELTEGLRADVGRSGALESLPLSCGEGCTLDAEGVDRLRRQAREEGATYLLVGKVHKMSTLVLSIRFAVLDTASGKLVMERLLSFRGDTDEGWRHAGAYVAREVAETFADAKN